MVIAKTSWCPSLLGPVSTTARITKEKEVFKICIFKAKKASLLQTCEWLIVSTISKSPLFRGKFSICSDTHAKTREGVGKSQHNIFMFHLVFRHGYTWKSCFVRYMINELRVCLARLKREVSAKRGPRAVSGYGWCRVYLRCHSKSSLLAASWASELKFRKTYFATHKSGNSQSLLRQDQSDAVMAMARCLK